jgi:aromatic ring-cleaving dioxygenase
MAKDATQISSFHAHVYFDPQTRDIAEQVREGLAAGFEVQLGRWHDKPIGPHLKSMYQVAFAAEQFSAVVPWLMLHHATLDVLIHPNTNDAVKDHIDHALWLGNNLGVNVEVLRQFMATEKKGVEHPYQST